jgi:cytochrome bd ubiquinol oxidase subunit I
MDFDPVLLARIQFAFTIAFHILFPAFTIGLASWLAMLELLWLVSGKPAYLSLYRFWLKVFAVSFGMGVVSGIVMSFQFGTNWSRFSEITGNVLGPLLSYEVMTAFFLEVSFLGIMLFGADRVGKGCTSSRPVSLPQAHSSPPSGSSRPIVGCTPRPGLSCARGSLW